MSGEHVPKLATAATRPVPEPRTHHSMGDKNAQDQQRPPQNATPTAVQVSQLLILHMTLHPDALRNTESIFLCQDPSLPSHNGDCLLCFHLVQSCRLQDSNIRARVPAYKQHRNVQEGFQNVGSKV